MQNYSPSKSRNIWDLKSNFFLSSSFLLLKSILYKFPIRNNQSITCSTNSFLLPCVRWKSPYFIQSITLAFQLQWHIQPWKFSHCKSNHRGSPSIQHYKGPQLFPACKWEQWCPANWSEMRKPLIITASICMMAYLLRMSKMLQHVIIWKG